MMNQARVVVTGMGLITPFGKGVPTNWKLAKAGNCAIRNLETVDTSTLGVKLGGEIPIREFKSEFPHKKLERFDRSVLLSLLAAGEAITNANLSPADCAETGVLIGTSFGTIQTKESSYLRAAIDESNIYPLIIIKGMDNAVASEISIQFGFKNINQTIMTACSSSTMALGEAFRLIKNRYVKRILVGGIDTPITYYMIKGWQKLHLISRAPKIDEIKSPFSKDRAGLVLSEGAGFAIIENDADAIARNAPIYGEIRGFGTNCDATHLSTPFADSQSKAIELALESAQTPHNQVDYINAHGTGTLVNDKVETQAIKLAFNRAARTIPISATKSQIGHTMGASGIIEVIFSLLMMTNNLLLPTINYVPGDADCDLDYVPNIPRHSQKINVILKTSFGFGGSNAVVVLSRYPAPL